MAGEEGAGAAAAAAAAGGEGGAAGGGRTEVLNTGNTPAAAAAPEAQSPEFVALLPDEYKTKPWIKDVKDLPSLLKRTDGLLTEMGKRPAGIPQDNAPKEEWDKFNKSFGVPEKADDYKLTPGTAEAPVDENFQKGIKGVFHEAGVSARQAAVLEKGYNKLLETLTAEKGAAAEKLNTDFDALAKNTFGDRKDDALKGARLLIGKYAPPAFKGHIEALDNNGLMVLAAVLDGVRKDFISEDRLPQAGGAPVGMTLEQKQARGRELMASPAYTNAFDPKHKEVVEEVRRLYGTV